MYVKDLEAICVREFSRMPPGVTNALSTVQLLRRTFHGSGVKVKWLCLLTPQNSKTRAWMSYQTGPWNKLSISLGYAEIESKKPKSFATSNCVLVNAGNLLFRLSRQAPELLLSFVEPVLKSDRFTVPKPGIAEGKHGTLRLMDTKRPFKKLEEGIVGAHFKSPSKKLTAKVSYFAIFCTSCYIPY